MDKDLEILHKETVYDGFFNLEKYTLKHSLFAGGWSSPIKRELFKRNNCVGVLLYDPVLDQVVLIEQFRIGAVYHPQHAWMLEIVAGGLEAGDSPEQAAIRECMEEAGCVVDGDGLQEIMQFYTTPGSSSERITLYYAEVDSREIYGVHGLHEEGEDILVRSMAAEEVFQLLQNGGIESAISIVALQWLQIHRSQLRKLG
jgi:ADP-ribose pyrophosphatase